MIELRGVVKRHSDEVCIGPVDLDIQAGGFSCSGRDAAMGCGRLAGWPGEAQKFCRLAIWTGRTSTMTTPALIMPSISAVAGLRSITRLPT